jgi:hypothetical protein
MLFTSYICIYNIIFYLIYILKKIHGPPKLYFLVPPLGPIEDIFPDLQTMVFNWYSCLQPQEGGMYLQTF